MAFNQDKAIEDLYILYQKSFAKITQRIIRDTKNGKLKTADVALLQSVNREIKNLLAINRQWVNKVVPTVYNEARQGIINQFIEAGRDAIENPAFRQIHNEAVKVLQQNLYDNLSKGTIQVGRKIRDELRIGILDIAATQTAGALTTDEAISEVLTDFAGKNIFSVKYSNGATMPINKYVDMALKTTIDSSINRSTITQSLEYENDLVMMSYHTSSCPVCALYEGRVYSISGESNKYPALSEINNGNMIVYGTVHPLCQHTLSAYIEELDDKQEYTERISNLPFEDDRNDFSRERYEKRQQQNGIRNRRDKKIEENKILKAIPDKSPEVESQIKRNSESIKAYNGKIKELKQWETDGINDGKLRKDVK